MKKFLFALGLVLGLASPVMGQNLVVETQPLPRLSTDASSTISVTDTFQTVWAQQNGPAGSSAVRASCAIQNNGTHNMWVFFGALASATEAHSVLLPPSSGINCGQNGVVATSQVSITGTSGDAFYASLDGASTIPSGGGTVSGTVTSNQGTSPWVSSITNGADVVEGSTTDAATTAGAAGTVSAKLRLMTSQLDTISSTVQGSIPAGSAIIGKVSIDQTTPGTTNAVYVTPQTTTGTASASFTSGTTGYVANDVVGASGANAALTFTGVCPASSNIMLTGIQMEVDSAAVISGQTGYALYLYSVTPPSAINDSSQWDIPSGDRASFLGGPIFTGTVLDVGSTLYIETNSVNKQVQCAASGNLFGYLVSLGAYTPTAQVYKVTIHATPL